MGSLPLHVWSTGCLGVGAPYAENNRAPSLSNDDDESVNYSVKSPYNQAWGLIVFKLFQEAGQYVLLVSHCPQAGLISHYTMLA